ncbi:MAG: endolytic transglycosylase MltG [Neisseriaceae bacterium]
MFFKTRKVNKVNLLIKIALIAFLAIAIFIGNIVFFPQSLPNGEYNLVVTKNQNLANVAVTLKKQRIIKSSLAFLILLRLLHSDKKVNAGMYILKHPTSLWGLVRRITHGKPDQISVTILDGWTFNQLKQYIDGLEDIRHITKNQTEKNIKSVLKIPEPNLEGVFYPDTYYVVPGQTDLEIYQHAYKMMQLKIESLFLAKNNSASVISPYQMLILASLIQKETSVPNDMYLISTVFNNRLKIGMKLQDDPAVFYGLKGQKKITRKDFQIDTPYNTYMHNGLPPTPICIPSIDALYAAAKPLNKPNVYYFLAIGNGRTKFSDNYQEHKHAINKYIKKLNK